MILPVDTNIFPRKKGVYIVGGTVRDLLCARSPSDFDVVVQRDPATFAQQLAAKTSGKLVQLGHQGQIMRRVITKDLYFDVLPLNGATIYEDLLQRDFTVNAMAVSVANRRLIDQLGGRLDLAQKKICMVSRDIFRKDPVRLIRAYRLAATLNFSIDADTHRILARDAHHVSKSAGERVREEFFKLLDCPESHAHLAAMANSGLLFRVLPELLALKNYRLPGAQNHILFEKTINSYYWLEKLLSSAGLFEKISEGRFIRDINANRTTLLKWAILFHNIGIPMARTFGDKKISHCYTHTMQSTAMGRKICQRLKFSKRQTDHIGLIIANHLQPVILFRAKQKDIGFQKGFARLFMKCRNLTPDILLHALAKCMEGGIISAHSRKEFSDFIQTLIRNYYMVLQPRDSLPSPINGNDLINEFGLKPSAEFKRILRQIEEAHLTKQVLTRHQALKLAEELISR